MAVNTETLLRIVPEEVEPEDATGRETVELHLERYRFAARHAQPGRLLDIACGVGYGTRLVADEAGKAVDAVGVDRSSEAIRYAAEHYACSGVSFQVSDALEFSDSDGFDTIVSLETIEHLPDPTAFVKHLTDLSKPTGVIVASVPVTPSVDVNPHHLHDFTPASFRSLFGRLGFVELASLRQVQGFPLRRVLGRQERRTKDLRPHLLRYYTRHPAALGRRLWSTLRHGLSNHYLTIAWRRGA